MLRAKISISTKRKAGIVKKISYQSKSESSGSLVGRTKAKTVMIVVISRVPEKNERRFESLRLISTFSCMRNLIALSWFPLQKFSA